MRFVASSSALFGRLQSISRVINSKNSLPILECFHFDFIDNALTITASDGETTLVTTAEIIECDSNARFCINAKTILESMKEISEQPLTFNINLDTNEIVVTYQNGTFSIIGQSANEYPQTTLMDVNFTELEMPASDLLSGINHCIFATADDELRPVMNGIHFDVTTENITFVASDGHKLVRDRNHSIHGQENTSFILPKKASTLLRNLLPKESGDVKVQFDQRNACIIMENNRLTCRLIEGRYPNYNSVIPENNPNRATIDRPTLLGALKRVLVFSSQSSALIKLHLEPNLLVVSGQDIDFSTSAEEKMMCDYNGTTMDIGFKGTFLIDILNNLSSQEIVLELADASRAGVVVPSEPGENEDVLMLLMPMMLTY
ncbi:MAG: DNA polymerase III subunit beta [Clostridium sp.]|nr:DNA polymerase III subunit beta [Clostridium sp.]